MLHLTTHKHESCVGAQAMVEFTGLLSFHRLLLQEESVFPPPSVQKTTWNDKLQLLEPFDIAGNCLMLAEVCA